MVIYLDVLILINLYVTYFQILAVSVFTHRKSVWYRKLSSAPAIGAMVADIVRDSLHLKENPAFDLMSPPRSAPSWQRWSTIPIKSCRN